MVTPMRNPEFIFKIATAEVVAEADRRGEFTGMPIDHSDGYLHFSRADQLAETLRLYFAGQQPVVLALRSADLGGALRWEPSRNGQLFPHVYGTFRMNQIAYRAVVDVATDGSVTLPGWVQ